MVAKPPDVYRGVFGIINPVTPISYFFFFILGAIVGSFLNVVIYRYHTGRTVVGGRSECMSCAKTLHWFELVPIFSFLLQGGRCRGCFSRISWQYPLVEILTGALFALLAWRFGLSPLLLLYFFIASLLVIIAVYDLRHKIIPTAPVWLFVAASLLAQLITAPLLLTAVLTGIGLAAFFAALWFFSRGRWMGFGDTKLALGMGILLGFPAGVSAIVVSFWLGAGVGLMLVFISGLSRRGKSVTIKSEIPFAPFMIIGLLLTWLFGLNVLFF